MIGQTLGHYRVLEKLGAGGMGEVYRAEDTTLDREVALKVLPAELAESQERLDRFEREAKTLAALDHPNIVHIYTVEEAEGVRFLTMQLVEGQRLSELIPRGGMPLERIFEIAIPLADALAAAHEKGVIHRDLKPANIMLSNDGRVKVLDFGLAKLRPESGAPEASALPTEPLTDEGLVVGTVPYMSPEQLEGRNLDARTDIFSLGAILYELATGRRPFQGDSSASVIAAIMTSSPQEVDGLRPELPHHLSRIIRHCLEKDPERRYQSVKDVRNELQDLQREETSQQVAVTPPMRGDKTASRTRWWALVAGSAVVVIALVALWLRQPPPSPPPVASPAEPAAAVEAQPPMIVVLPFENLGDPEDEYFADGMTEEITSRLAVVSGLGVISRTSAMQYKENRPSMKQVGEELGVDYVLEGTVRWEKPSDGPSRVRVTPQLIRVSDDVHMWSERYDRTLEEIFAVQSAVAEEVIARVGVELLSRERAAIDARPTDNPDAYAAYLRGVNHRNDPDYSESTFRMAAQMFERAIELDPDFVQAHALLSMVHSRMFWESYDRTEERLYRARKAAERALELDPSSPYGHIAMGRYHYRGERNYELALEELRTAETLLPSEAEVYYAIGAVQRRQGRFEEAVVEFQKAVALDPRSPFVLDEFGVVYVFLRRYAEAEQFFSRSISVAPDQELSYNDLATNSILWKGDTEEARAVLEKMPETEHPWSILAWVSLELYDRDYQTALRWLSLAPAEMTPGIWEQRVVARTLWEGMVHQLMGEDEKAVAVYEAALPGLERAIEEYPESPADHSNLGWAYAGLGRGEEAIRQGKRAVDLHPMAKDALTGPFYVEMLAQIAVMAGDYDLGLDQLDTLLSVPSYFSASLLRLDPRWDPLRDHPRFQALLEKYGLEAGS